MMVRLIRKLQGTRKEYTEPCDHVGVDITPPDCYAAREGLSNPGIVVELVSGSKITQVWRLPEDGDEIYLMNDAGDTTHCYRWPLAEARQEKTA